ncbi:MAG: DUF4258 domain-containing protein [Candidatus Eremiobacteraeota bacterium]|nr:DUF4258 domain-containing protein [Candidatus Eremiobacteraeota bacterium]MBV8354071.1 DUF4258 domain-containing protein [Candidatus Eremiobacteraeota bacterium]
MRPFHFSQHALEKIRERGILLEWIGRVIHDRSRVEVGYGGRPSILGQVPEFGGRWLRVVLSRDQRTVVTAYFDWGVER